MRSQTVSRVSRSSVSGLAALSLVGGGILLSVGAGAGVTPVSLGTAVPLAATAPTVTSQPADVSVFAGQTATFTAAASGSPSPTVQWYVSVNKGTFTKIVGATSPTLTVADVTASMNGNRYLANFHNSVGHATSRAALLTVKASSLDHLAISPATASIKPGASQTYAAEGFSSTGADLGDVTASTTFTISPDGTCQGSACTATTPGSHTVTGTDQGASGQAQLTVASGPFIELIFSRTEVTAADGASCAADDAGIARLDTTIAPFLDSLGLSATGSIEVAPMQQNAFWCSHFGFTLSASWAAAQALGARGWTFVDHSLDYPSAAKWSALSAAGQWDETCGSAQTIDAHGLTGADTMFLWPGPGSQANPTALVNDVEPCFGTNRAYLHTTSSASQLSSAPYQQAVWGIGGGFCNTPGAPCATITPATNNPLNAYTTPAQIIAAIQALTPGQVLSLQTYIDVTGTNPAYATNADRWDCTSSDPNLHWTNDAERYCWVDLQTILSFVASSGIGISQPGVVNTAFGRLRYSDHAVARPAG